MQKPASALWNLTVMIAQRFCQMMSSVSFHAFQAINGAVVVNTNLKFKFVSLCTCYIQNIVLWCQSNAIIVSQCFKCKITLSQWQQGYCLMQSSAVF